MADAARITVAAAHNIGARESQQDSFGVSDITNETLTVNKGVFAVVADGMGGLSGGAEAGSAVVRAMLGLFEDLSFVGSPDAELLTMTAQANAAVCRLCSGGSTCVAAIIREGGLWFSSVGDSRIALLRGGGLVTLNREHVYARDLDIRAANGETSWETAVNDEQRPALTRYLGKGELETVDYSRIPVRLIKGDKLLLMSDGVFNALPDEELCAMCAGKPEKCAAAVEKKISEKNAPGQDNFTLVIIEYKGN